MGADLKCSGVQYLKSMFRFGVSLEGWEDGTRWEAPGSASPLSLCPASLRRLASLSVLVFHFPPLIIFAIFHEFFFPMSQFYFISVKRSEVSVCTNTSICIHTHWCEYTVSS